MVNTFGFYFYMKKGRIILLHFLFWFYEFFWGLITLPLRKPGVAVNWSQFYDLFTITGYFLLPTTFYLNYSLVMPRFFARKKYGPLAVSWLLLYAWYIGMRYLIEEVLYLKWFGIHNYWEGTTAGYYIADNIFYASSIIVPSIMIWTIIHWTQMEKEKLELKTAAGTAEINFLKSQVNPHFLFNTLNNIYSLVYHQSEKALPAIMRLSELMRYMTRESSADEIQLTKEIQYIESFIELESLRVAGDAYVQLTVSGNTESVKVAPLLLIPFVENGFKHGVVTNSEVPFVITLSVNNKVLHLRTANKINASQKDRSGGVGLQNVRRRLELIYPGKHQLTTERKGDSYVCELMVELS